MTSQMIKHPTFRQAITGLLFLQTGFLAHSADAAQEWNNGGSGSWFTAVNWTPAVVPNSTLDALINNGGEATATAGGPVSALSVSVGKNDGQGELTIDGVNASVQQSLDIGDVDGIFATGPVNVTSHGTATLSNMSTLVFGASGNGDLNAGQTSATGDAVAHGIGSLTIDTVVSVDIAGDLDIGQTSGSGTATGDGEGLIRNVSSLFSIGGDLDVGQTSGLAGGFNQGTGLLQVDDVNELSIGVDVDVAQVTGPGQSSGMGTLLVDKTDVTIADSFDIAKIRSLMGADNSATGHATIGNGNLSVGFGALSPGSIDIARVQATENATGTADGTLILDQVDALIGNNVTVGELSLGGTNASNSANGHLQLIDSRLDTRDLTVAARLDGTAGSVAGTVRLTRSLAIVQSVATFYQNSTLQIDIHGTTRALGDGTADDYGALDADMAVVGGALEINPAVDYQGPITPGSIDTFDLITTLFGLTGEFASVTYDGVSVDADPAYVGAAGNGTDGLFVSVEQTASQFLLTNYLALRGDANGDRVVDGADFIIWNANKFTGGTDWTSGDFNGDGVTDGQDFIVWNTNKFTSVDQLTPVPEPAALPLVLCALLLAASGRAPHLPMCGFDETHR